MWTKYSDSCYHSLNISLLGYVEMSDISCIQKSLCRPTVFCTITQLWFLDINGNKKCDSYVLILSEKKLKYLSFFHDDSLLLRFIHDMLSYNRCRNTHFEKVFLININRKSLLKIPINFTGVNFYSFKYIFAVAINLSL
jgi:hypothetical protein